MTLWLKFHKSMCKVTVDLCTDFDYMMSIQLIFFFNNIHKLFPVWRSHPPVAEFVD